MKHQDLTEVAGFPHTTFITVDKGFKMFNNPIFMYYFCTKSLLPIVLL